VARPWYWRQEIPDPQVRDAADQFESARQLLWAQPPGSGLLYPLLNTAAVAIELYLKSLSAEKVYSDAGGGWANISSKPSMRGHVLTTIFDNIDGDLQAELEGTFGIQLSAFGVISFRDALSRCEGAFQESRYPFEPASHASKYPLGLLMACSDFLRQFVAKLQTVEKIR
jgi:hypothetical protein